MGKKSDDDEFVKHPAIHPHHRGKVVTFICLGLLIVLGVAAFDAFNFGTVFSAVF